MIYMGMGGLEEISRQPISHGLDLDTPAALIHKATLPEQKFHTTSVAALAKTARQMAVVPPSLVVIGSVVSLAYGNT